MPSTNDAPMPLPGALAQPVAERHERARQPVGQRARQERDAEERKQYECRDASVLIGMDRPSAAECCERGDAGEGERHAGQERQAALRKRLVGAGAKTKGSTGRMHGLRIVSTPPR